MLICLQKHAHTHIQTDAAAKIPFPPPNDLLQQQLGLCGAETWAVYCFSAGGRRAKKDLGVEIVQKAPFIS